MVNSIDKEKMNELLDLTENKEHSRLRIVLPAAFVFSAAMWSIAALIGRQEHSLFLYITGFLAIGVLYYQVKENRKHKSRITQLKLELGVR